MVNEKVFPVGWHYVLRGCAELDHAGDVALREVRSINVDNPESHEDEEALPEDWGGRFICVKTGRGFPYSTGLNENIHTHIYFSYLLNEFHSVSYNIQKEIKGHLFLIH